MTTLLVINIIFMEEPANANILLYPEAREFGLKVYP